MYDLPDRPAAGTVRRVELPIVQPTDGHAQLGGKRFDVPDRRADHVCSFGSRSKDSDRVAKVKVHAAGFYPPPPKNAAVPIPGFLRAKTPPPSCFPPKG